MMRACFYSRYGGSDVVELGDIPRPRPGRGQVLVRVAAASLNPADLKLRAGSQRMALRAAFPKVFGFDVAGTVCERGPGAGRFAVGTPVCGMVKGARTGSCAEFCPIDEDVCAELPSGVSMEDAAAVPLVSLTACAAFELAGLRATGAAGAPRVLIVGGAGGVGTHAVQLARTRYGASFVAATASPGRKTEMLRGLGVDMVLDYRQQWWDEPRLPRFDAVLDCVGEAARCPRLLADGGGLVSILASPTAECMRIWLRDSATPSEDVTCGVAGFLGCGFGASLLDFLSGASGLQRACDAVRGKYGHVIGTGDGEMMQNVSSLLAEGKLRAVVDRVYSLEQAPEALAYLATGRAAGKVVIRIEQKQSPAQPLEYADTAPSFLHPRQ